jgi:VWFA-related protein
VAFTQQADPSQSPAQQTTALNQRPAYAPAPAPAEGRIHLDVVATDKAGKPVSGLELQDFTLKDNNLPAKILSFRAVDTTVQQAGYPAEVVLVLDAVNQGVTALDHSREQIEDFLRKNGGHLAQPVSILLCNDDDVKVLLQPSMDGNALAAQLDKINTGLRAVGRSAGRNGAFEQFDLSLKWLTIIAMSEAKRPDRKLVIWIGGGWPMLDRASFQLSSKQEQLLFGTIVDLSARLREARISLYSVSMGVYVGAFLYEDFLKGVKTADKVNLPNLSLKVLATQSGGRVLGPDNDITSQIVSCIQDARAFYTLSFDPPKADRANEYHDLKVEIGKPGLTARTSTGYYNQP